MSYKTRSTFWTDANARFTTGIDKWSGQEIDDSFKEINDSTQWQDPEITLTDAATVTWDYTLSSEAVVTIAGNRTLSITNLPTDRVVYLTLRVIQDVSGGWSLTLPSNKSNGGVINTTAAAESIITFRWNGASLRVSIMQVA